MVSVFGWPDPNTRESGESREKRTKHEPNSKASDFARSSQLEQLYQVFGSGHPNLSPLQRFPCFSVNSFSFSCFSVMFCMNSDDYVCGRKRN